MPYRELQRITDEAQARELGEAMQEVTREFERMPNRIPATAVGASYATAIAQGLIERLCPTRGYRVTCTWERTSRTCNLRIEEWLPDNEVNYGK